jgi:hypothetical protein
VTSDDPSRRQERVVIGSETTPAELMFRSLAAAAMNTSGEAMIS